MHKHFHKHHPIFYTISNDTGLSLSMAFPCLLSSTVYISEECWSSVEPITRLQKDLYRHIAIFNWHFENIIKTAKELVFFEDHIQECDSPIWVVWVLSWLETVLPYMAFCNKESHSPYCTTSKQWLGPIWVKTVTGAYLPRNMDVPVGEGTLLGRIIEPLHVE